MKKLIILVFLLLPVLAFAAPAFHGVASIQMNIPPAFDGLDATTPFIRYGQLDKLGRATRAVGLLGPELIANERASIIFSKSRNSFSVIICLLSITCPCAFLRDIKTFTHPRIPQSK